MGISNDVKRYIRLTVDKGSGVKSKLVKIYGDCHGGGFDILDRLKPFKTRSKNKTKKKAVTAS